MEVWYDKKVRSDNLRKKRMYIEYESSQSR